MYSGRNTKQSFIPSGIGTLNAGRVRAPGTAVASGGVTNGTGSNSSSFSVRGRNANGWNTVWTQYQTTTWIPQNSKPKGKGKSTSTSGFQSSNSKSGPSYSQGTTSRNRNISNLSGMQVKAKSSAFNKLSSPSQSSNVSYSQRAISQAQNKFGQQYQNESNKQIQNSRSPPSAQLNLNQVPWPQPPPFVDPRLSWASQVSWWEGSEAHIDPQSVQTLKQVQDQRWWWKSSPCGNQNQKAHWKQDQIKESVLKLAYNNNSGSGSGSSSSSSSGNGSFDFSPSSSASGSSSGCYSPTNYEQYDEGNDIDSIDESMPKCYSDVLWSMQDVDSEEITGFLIDLDGTMYDPNGLLPGAADFYAWLTLTGKQFVFLSNTSSKGSKGVQDKFNDKKYSLQCGMVVGDCLHSSTGWESDQSQSWYQDKYDYQERYGYSKQSIDGDGQPTWEQHKSLQWCKQVLKPPPLRHIWTACEAQMKLMIDPELGIPHYSKVFVLSGEHDFWIYSLRIMDPVRVDSWTIATSLTDSQVKDWSEQASHQKKVHQQRQLFQRQQNKFEARQKYKFEKKKTQLELWGKKGEKQLEKLLKDKDNECDPVEHLHRKQCAHMRRPPGVYVVMFIDGKLGTVENTTRLSKDYLSWQKKQTSTDSLSSSVSGGNIDRTATIVSSAVSSSKSYEKKQKLNQNQNTPKWTTTDWGFDLIRQVSYLLHHGAKFVYGADDAFNPSIDPDYPDMIFPQPGPGMFWAMFQKLMFQFVATPSIYSNSVKQRVFCAGKGGNYGKRFMMEHAIDMLKVQGHSGDKSKIMMVGDRFDTDIRGGKSVGIKTCFVESGVHRLVDLELETMEDSETELSEDDFLRKEKKLHKAMPDYYASGIGDLIFWG